MKIWTLVVHPLDLRRGEPSTHGGCGPGPAYPEIPAMPHRELTHTVEWSPMGAKFGRSIFGDANEVCLFGNDSGIGIPHASAPADNLDLPLTILTSMCKWLFASSQIQTDGQAIVGFAPWAPYLGCQAPVPAAGIKWLPLQGTVVLPMSATDLILGWIRVFAAIGLTVVTGAVFSKVGFKPKAVDDHTAARIGRELLERQAKRAARVDRVVTSTVNDALKGMSVSVVVEGKISMPYQIGEIGIYEDRWVLLVWESNTGPRTERAPYVNRLLEPKIARKPEGPIAPALAELLDGVPLVNGDDG